MEPPSAYLLSTASAGTVHLLAIALLLAVSAVMSACELAFFSLTTAQLRELKEQGGPNGARVGTLLTRPRRLLATILIAGNVANLGVIVLATHAMAGLDGTSPMSGWSGLLLQVLIVAFTIVLIGEVVPKAYAISAPVAVARRMAGTIEFLRWVLWPVTELLVRGADLIEKRFADRAHRPISVDTLGKALDLAGGSGTTVEEQRILRGIVQFGHVEVRQAMRPRTEVVGFSRELNIKELLHAIVGSGFSRVPVFDGSLDQVIGILHIKDLLPHLEKPTFHWHTLLREPYFVPESKKLDDLLKEFQRGKVHLAVVVDEYGSTSGIITLEDVIEEIVGDITDEYDEDDLVYSKLDDRTWLFEGRTPLTDVYRTLGIDGQLFEDNKGDSGTLGGFLLELTGRIPRKGERADLRNFTFVVDASDNKRVRRVKVIMHDETED